MNAPSDAFEIDIRHAFTAGDFRLDVAFTAPPGVTALYGPSGSGKSSVAKAVAGLFRPHEAKIAIAGRTLGETGRVDVPAAKRGLAIAFQEPRLLPHRTVMQNLTFGGRSTNGALRDTIDLLGLAPLLVRYPRALSGGEAQRVSLGRALLHPAHALILDEPLTALDPKRRERILDALASRSERTPILLITHDVADIVRLDAHMVLMRAGRVLRTGPVAQILAAAEVAEALGAGVAGGILTGRVLAHHDSQGLSEVETGGGHLFLPRLTTHVAEPVRVRIAARDIILARDRPTRISALNVLEATVVAVDQSGTVVVRIGQDVLCAQVTRRSLDALNLVPGLAIHAIVKASAIAD